MTGGANHGRTTGGANAACGNNPRPGGAAAREVTDGATQKASKRGKASRASRASKADAALARERKDNMGRKVCHREWRFLTDQQRSLAQLLGFSGESGWNDDDEEGWARTPKWSEMSEEQTSAALALQFEPTSWWGPPPWDI